MIEFYISGDGKMYILEDGEMYVSGNGDSFVLVDRNLCVQGDEKVEH